MEKTVKTVRAQTLKYTRESSRMNDYLKARELFNEWWFIIIVDVYQIFIRGDVTLTESNMRNSFPLHQHSD